MIRQESAFNSNALSPKGAVGLMQVLPKTASKLARQVGVRYVRTRLTDPGYNLQLGSHYLAGLIKTYGTPEAALAAYTTLSAKTAWCSGQLGKIISRRLSSWNRFRSPRRGSTYKS